MTMTLGPTLVRLCLDVAESDDDSAWDLACSLVDEMDLAQAKRTAWDTTLFLTKLLSRLSTEHPELVDRQAIVAEWGLAAYTDAEGIEVAP